LSVNSWLTRAAAAALESDEPARWAERPGIRGARGDERFIGYVTPKLAQGLSASAGATQVATTLLAGMLAVVILFHGIFAVGMPLIQEFGYTREIEDRALSPLPVGLVAVAKVIAGALQGLLAALVVFPLAVFIPSSRPDLHIHWAVLLTLAPLAALMCSSLGLFIGTVFDPRTVTAMAAIILPPLMFLGCTLYPGARSASSRGSRHYRLPIRSLRQRRLPRRGDPGRGGTTNDSGSVKTIAAVSMRALDAGDGQSR
jgi:hypothetical protein